MKKFKQELIQEAAEKYIRDTIKALKEIISPNTGVVLDGTIKEDDIEVIGDSATWETYRKELAKKVDTDQRLIQVNNYFKTTERYDSTKLYEHMLCAVLPLNIAGVDKYEVPTDIYQKAMLNVQKVEQNLPTDQIWKHLMCFHLSDQLTMTDSWNLHIIIYLLMFIDRE